MGDIRALVVVEVSSPAAQFQTCCRLQSSFLSMRINYNNSLNKTRQLAPNYPPHFADFPELMKTVSQQQYGVMVQQYCRVKKERFLKLELTEQLRPPKSVFPNLF